MTPIISFRGVGPELCAYENPNKLGLGGNIVFYVWFIIGPVWLIIGPVWL